MAKDVIDLLQHVGWLPSPLPSSSTTEPTPQRTIHIVGISMGGMIAQELALLIPSHILSLNLVSTAPRIVRTVPFIANLRQRINMFIPRDIDVQLQETGHRLFSDTFLAGPDLENKDQSEKNFPSNYERFAAGELQKRGDPVGFTKKGFILQAIAAGWHHKSAGQISEIGDETGRKRITVVHGTEDRMIDFKHFELLKEELGGEDSGCTFRTWNGKGHVLVWEVEEEFNEFMEKRFEECEKLGDGS
jgi:pimeloyl-ACP methyl ester carboxylesterase